MPPQKLIAIGLMSVFSIGMVGVSTPAYSAETKAKQQKKHVAKKKVVFQVSDLMAKKWTLALNNAANVQKELGAENVEIEIVAYGPGLDMLKLESEVGDRVATALASGVKIVACQNTMRNQELTDKDMLPGIGYVPAGVVELMKRQDQGYAYIRP